MSLGTGISLFVAYNNRLGLNVSATLDNNFTTINWFILDVDETSPTVTTYNATLYNIQELDEGNHHLVVTLQDYKGSESDMMFDYAAVNGTKPSDSSLGSSEYVPPPFHPRRPNVCTESRRSEQALEED